jgi:hypothetical protein
MRMLYQLGSPPVGQEETFSVRTRLGFLDWLDIFDPPWPSGWLSEVLILAITSLLM